MEIHMSLTKSFGLNFLLSETYSQNDETDINFKYKECAEKESISKTSASCIAFSEEH